MEGANEVQKIPRRTSKQLAIDNLNYQVADLYQQYHEALDINDFNSNERARLIRDKIQEIKDNLSNVKSGDRGLIKLYSAIEKNKIESFNKEKHAGDEGNN